MSGGAPREPGSARMILTLGCAGLFAGILLVGAYEATLPAIEANRAAALRAAVFEVVPGAAAMREVVFLEGALRPAGDAPADAPAVYAAYGEDGGFRGYAVPGSGAGFQDTIALIYGYDPEAERIVGMAVLESRETPGLGDKIFKDREFVAQFRDRAAAPPLELVKPGAAEEPHEVDGISGATISSKAVVRIINATQEIWRGRLTVEAAPPAPSGQPTGEER